jgi:hypothetical protein
MMADQGLVGRLQSGRTRVKTMVTANKTDEELIEELFLATVSRFPTRDEKAKCVDHLKQTANRQNACNDILWALLNTTEFIFNH